MEGLSPTTSEVSPPTNEMSTPTFEFSPCTSIIRPTSSSVRPFYYFYHLITYYSTPINQSCLSRELLNISAKSCVDKPLKGCDSQQCCISLHLELQCFCTVELSILYCYQAAAAVNFTVFTGSDLE